MKKILLLPFILFLVSCWMTNEEIVKEVKFCWENSMDYEMRVDAFWNVFGIVCYPDIDRNGW